MRTTLRNLTQPIVISVGFLLLAVLVGAAIVSMISAADPVGGLIIRIVDAQGAPVEGVHLTLSHRDGVIPPTTVVTDHRGQASFPVLRPGIGYLLEVSYAGATPQRIPGIEIVARSVLTLTVDLGGRILETVELVDVTASPSPRSKLKNPNSIGMMEQLVVGEAEYEPAAQSTSYVRVKKMSRQQPWEESGNTESYDHVEGNPFFEVFQRPLSTFSIDVDTASYANVRRFLANGSLPPKGAVRIEELINYFRYAYSGPTDGAPFGIEVEIADVPWKPEHRLARIGIKGQELAPGERPASNLVFLLDVSGSMNQANKLPLVKQAMKMLTEQLGGSDRVSIVVYAGAAGLVLPSSFGDDRAAILDAIERLDAGGSTAGGAGIRLAYETARSGFISGGINRVILCTDGDFNVGVSSESELVELVRRQAKSGVFLTVLGFGMGNLKDSTLEALADKGNGHYAYIDSQNEARKVLVEEIGSTLVTIAKDVKIQVEFNPAEVAAYRLIGYENRRLHARDFNDDTKDAGEIGAGHTVTALYEIVPAGQPVDLPSVDELKYQKVGPSETSHESAELFTVKVRYKQPDGEKSSLITRSVIDSGASLAAASDDLRFAAAVAAFGMQLRESEHLGSFDVRAIAELARQGMGRDQAGHRTEFVRLVEQAAALQSEVAIATESR